MSLPPLPEVFGNYALKDFVEVTAPGAISWLPQTVGWRYLGVALLALLAWRAWHWLKRWHHNRYRREALRELACLETLVGDSELVPAVNALLKRSALAVYPRSEVASLTGEAWLAFLVGECEASPFDPTSSQLLVNGSYRPEIVDAASARALLAACESWITGHRGVAP